jgi:HNH endonuclease/NUMOD4 motif-containing protein
MIELLNIEREQWQNIPGFDKCYFVSTHGNFKSIGREERNTRRICKRNDRILTPKHEGNGYLQIGLMVKYKQTRFLAHRLVAITFLVKPEGKDFVNHKNGIKDDNRIENLEWCTKSENAKHSFSIGTQCNKGEMHPGHKLTKIQVEEIRSKYISRLYPSRKLAKEYNISKRNVLDIVNKKIWVA